MTAHDTQKPDLDHRRQEQFLRTFGAGDQIASKILPKVMAGAVSYDQAALRLQDVLQDSPEQHVASFLLTIPELVKLGETGNSNDMQIIAKGNEALKQIMLDASGTHVSQHAFISACMRFARTHLITTSGDSLAELENRLTSEVIGMWHEQSFTNLLYAGGAKVQEATRSQDLTGIDLFVKASGNRDIWVPVDVKASDTGITRALEKKNADSTGLTYMQGNHQYGGLAYFTPELHNPALAVGASRDRVFVHLITGQNATDLAPMDFRSAHAPQIVAGFQAGIDKLVRGNFDAYTTTRDASGKEVLAPVRILRKMGKTASKVGV